jgi:excisionase family DNA binding protein
MTEPPLVYRVDEVAELLGCGKSTVYDAIARGELPGVLRLGRRVLVSKAALHAALGLTAATTDSSQENGAADNGAAKERGSLELHGEHKGQARR